jgi:hypothetical protein
MLTRRRALAILGAAGIGTGAFRRALAQKAAEGPVSPQMAGRAYDENTLLALADAYQRAIGLKERPPLEKFLAEKDQFLKDETLPDENKLYID